jgi:hypothetical protein
MDIAIVSALAVTGAWVAGIAVLFAILSFCFGIIRPSLFRYGIVYLLITDVGIILMLASLLYLINDAVLWTASLVGLILMVLLTVVAIGTVRSIRARGDIPQLGSIIETTRQRIEF